MAKLVALLVVFPALTVTLYVFTRMLELSLRAAVHPAVKVFAWLTMLAALVSAGVVIIGSSGLAEYFLVTIGPFRPLAP